MAQPSKPLSKPFQSHFEMASYADHWGLAKSVTKLRHVTSMFQVHFPIFDRDGGLYDTKFAPIIQSVDWHRKQKTGEGGWTEHFWTKSFTEFLVKKRRGEALGLTDSFFLRAYETFFQWTRPWTPESHAPWPEVMLARTKERMARFAVKPGFAALQSKIAADFAIHCAAVQADPAMHALFEEMKARLAK
ncbi:MAG: hypothetical protein WCC36_11650 [Gammaproteobacteria bacterium]